MLRPERRIERVYLHRAPIDMRRQIDGLAALVEGVIKSAVAPRSAPAPGCADALVVLVIAFDGEF